MIYEDHYYLSQDKNMFIFEVPLQMHLLTPMSDSFAFRINLRLDRPEILLTLHALSKTRPGNIGSFINLTNLCQEIVLNPAKFSEKIEKPSAAILKPRYIDELSLDNFNQLGQCVAIDYLTDFSQFILTSFKEIIAPGLSKSSVEFFQPRIEMLAGQIEQRKVDDIFTCNQCSLLSVTVLDLTLEFNKNKRFYDALEDTLEQKDNKQKIKL